MLWSFNVCKLDGYFPKNVTLELQFKLLRFEIGGLNFPVGFTLFLKLTQDTYI